MCELGRAVLAVFLAGLLRGGSSLQPCSELFAYQRGGDNRISAQLIFDNDRSKICNLEVRMATATRSNESVQIVRKISKKDIERGWKIVYEVQFPKSEISEDALPTPIRVIFNNDVHCSDPVPAGTVATQDIFSYINLRAKNEKSSQLAATRRQQITSTVQSSPGEWKCGIKFNSRKLILDGRPTRDGEYPWLVALFYRENDEFNYKCTGTLVSDKHVVTAAHCVKKVNKNILYTVFGTNNIEKVGNLDTVSRRTEEIIVHSDYVAEPASNDIAVIIIDAPLKFTSLISPICMWKEQVGLTHIVGQNGTIVGWGADSDTGPHVNQARQIDIPIVDQETCLRSDENGRFVRLTTSRTFCAGSRDGRIPCRGDSGGGFVMEREGSWTLRGVVSTALSNDGGCDGKHYAVFSDVAKYLPWLNEILKRS